MTKAFSFTGNRSADTEFFFYSITCTDGWLHLDPHVIVTRAMQELNVVSYATRNTTIQIYISIDFKQRISNLYENLLSKL